MQNRSMLMPAVWGGITMGLLSALPVVSIGNLCCCAWLIVGGLVAAYLLQNNTAEPITPGDGALVGLLAGLIGAVVQTLVSLPINLVTGPVQQRLVSQILENAQDVPENVRQMMEGFGSSSALTLIGAVFGFFMMLVLGAIFSTVGGLLGAVFFKKKITA